VVVVGGGSSGAKPPEAGSLLGIKCQK